MNEGTLQYRLNKVFDEYKDQIAIRYGTKQITYAGIKKKSHTIANWLIRHHMTNEEFVGIFVEDRVEFISLIIGTLMARSVFIPLDSVYPMDRIKQMIALTELKLIITDRNNYEKIKELQNNDEQVVIMLIEDIYATEGADNLVELSTFNYTIDDKIYIYFTSGSTGVPKAIVGRNQSLLHFMDWEIDALGIRESFRISHFTSPGFDASLRDYFTALFAGGTICIPSNRQMILDAETLRDWIEDEKINLIHCTPSLFKLINSQVLNSDNYSELKYILMAGEKISPQELSEWYKTFGDRIQLVNLYGATETTLVKTFYLIKSTDVERTSIPAGQPIRGTKFVVIDEKMNICPKGQVGEILIRTPFRSHGYYKNAEMNSEKFIPNPFSKDKNDIVYRTGDLGRILPDGNLEVLGRIDRQVKIRGIRVEMGEIENALLTYEAVRNCIIIDRQNDKGEIYLCAYVLLKDTKGEIPFTEIRNFLMDKLPEYMIPQYFVQLDSIPVTPNGKVDIKALPDPQKSKQYECIEPRNEIEKELVIIWKDILGLEEVGVTQSFFLIGGHSLVMMSMVSRIELTFGVKVPMEKIFNNPTIELIAKMIKESRSVEFKPIIKVENHEFYPTSSAQKRMYILNRFEGTSTSYNISKVIIINGNIDKERCQYAFEFLVKRHESLRTSLEFVHEEPVQILHEEVDFKIHYLEILDHELERGVREFIRPFNLSVAPLFRVGLFKFSNKEGYALAFDIHHIIADGISMDIIIKEFISVYFEKELPPLSIQYKDFSAWQNTMFEDDIMKEQEKYWLHLFADEVPILNMTTNYPRPTLQSFQGDRVEFMSGKELAEGIKKLVRDTETTLYMVLLAAYNVLLSKYSSQEEIVVGSPIAGRTHADLSNIIGMFVNTLALKNNPKRELTFIQFVDHVKNNALNAYQNQDYPFEELVMKLNVTRDMSRNPIFDTMFTLQNTGGESIHVEGYDISPYHIENTISKFDFSLDALETEQEIKFNLEYCTSLFKRDTMEHMSVHFMNILKEVVNNPSVKLGEIKLLSIDEEKDILYRFNDTKMEYPRENTFQNLFEEQVGKNPKRTAVRFIDTSLTYDELNSKSNRIARFLREKGVKPGDIIGIMVERSIDMISGMIGIIKSGAAYLPVDPYYPQDRINYMLEDSRVVCMLTSDHLKDIVNTNCEIISLQDHRISTMDMGNVENINQPSDLLYVIYTSGTTGKPKGVMIEHRNYISITYAWKKEYRLESMEVNLLQIANFSFDVFAGDVSRSLLNGGTLILCPEEIRLNPGEIYQVLQKYEVSIFESTPSLVVPLMDYIYNNNLILDKLKIFIIGADVISVEDFIRISTRFGDKIRVLNSYGVTEVTIDNSFFEMSMGSIVSTSNVPIGKALPNQMYYILDHNLNAVPVGVLGELYIGGDGVGRGYLYRDDLTSQKFLPDPFVQGNRMYKTGDLAKWLPEGIVEFMGRVDNQVKIRGYRIELGEIESRLLALEFIIDALIIAKKDDNGVNVVCAYYVAEKPLEAASIKQFMAKNLPNYMIPSYFVQLDKFPVTLNGKIDRKSLPNPKWPMEETREYIAPINDSEKLLEDIWRDVLGEHRIGTSDNFFDLGGDSIKVIRILSKLYEKKLKFDMKDIIQYPTIKELSKCLKKVEKEIFQGDIYGEVLLTPIQEAFFEQNYKDVPNYNQSVMLFRKEGFQEEWLHLLFEKLVSHHDTLRMRYERSDDKVRQYNRKNQNGIFTLRVIDMQSDINKDESTLSSSDIKKRIMGELTQLDLFSGNLMKLILLKTNEGDHLVVAIHHLLVDTYSWRILLEDFSILYLQMLEHKEMMLPPKTDSFKEWAEKIHQYANSHELISEIPFWRHQETMNMVQLPKDYDSTSSSIQGSGEVLQLLSEEETERLISYSKQKNGLDINQILIAATAMTMKKWAGVDKTVLMMEGHGREEILEDMNVSRTVGWFTTEYPVVIDLEGSINMSDSLERVNKCAESMPNHGIGYGILKYITSEENKKGMHFCLQPQINLNYLGQFDEDIKSDIFVMSDYMTREMSVSNEDEIKMLLNIMALTVEHKLHVYIVYNFKDYCKDTIEAISDQFMDYLKEIIQFCEQDLKVPSIATEAFLHKI